MMIMKPSEKADDSDVRALSVKLSSAAVTADCGCGCACCVAGHGGPVGQRGVPTERLLHREPERVAAGALQRRRALIAEKLLPRAKQLTAALAEGLDAGLAAGDDLQVLGALQAWIHELQQEEEALRLALTPPRLDASAP